MASTIVTYVGDGTTTDFAFPFDYLRRGFVKVLVDGDPVAFTFHTANTVRITPAPADGAVLIIQRQTDRERLVTFVDGSILLAGNLNTAQIQAIHIAAEADDAASGSLLIDETGAYSASFRRIALLGEPTQPNDAVTKQWAETAMASELAQAIAARSAAQAAAADADADRVAAQTARTGAETAQTGAQTARTGAETAQTGAQTARMGAETARDAAIAARTGAETARDAAIAARTGAETAEDNAAASALAAAASASVLDPSVYQTQNRIINGNFHVWQRGPSFAGGPLSGYGADRWRHQVGGTGLITVNQTAFALGTKLGRNNPNRFLSFTTSSMSGAASFAWIEQRIENVRSYAGETITLLFWAKRATAGDIAIEFAQFFGTGGSPSPIVDISLANPRLTLTTGWQPYAVTVTIPSVAGKTLGTNANDYLTVRFITSAGSDFNARSNNLGHQNTTLDLWGVHILPGIHSAAMCLNYLENPMEVELVACQRFYEVGRGFGQLPVTGLGNIGYQYTTRKRNTPNVSAFNPSGTGYTNLAQQSSSADTVNWNFQATLNGGFISFDWASEAEL